jgi:hypothetical protein
VLIDASHKKWLGASVGLAVVAGIAYVPYTRWSLNGPSGGSWSGLAYGVAGTGLLVYAALLGARKKVPTWRVGRAQTWLKGHIWLGLLSAVLILLHGRFALGGALTTVMMLLLGTIVASGIFGVVLQQILPRTMTSQAPLETIFEQIDHVSTQLRAEADHLMAIACGEEARERKHAPEPAIEGSDRLKELYHRDVRPLLGKEPAQRRAWVSAKQRAALFTQWRTLLPAAAHDIVGELEALCEEHRQLEVQRRLHHWLHGWLFVHVPLSMALLVLTLAHAVIALRY